MYFISLYTLASGTIGAALDAALCKKKAIALSFAFYNRELKDSAITNACTMGTLNIHSHHLSSLLCSLSYQPCFIYILRTAINVITHLWKTNQWPENGLFNINVPVIDHACPVYVTRIHKKHYGSLFRTVTEGNDKRQEQETKAVVAIDDDDIEREVRIHAETGDREVVYRFAPNESSLPHSVKLPEMTDAWAVVSFEEAKGQEAFKGLSFCVSSCKGGSAVVCIHLIL